MVKLDIVLFPFVLLLRVSLLVLSLSLTALKRTKLTFCAAVKRTQQFETSCRTNQQFYLVLVRYSLGAPLTSILDVSICSTWGLLVSVHFDWNQILAEALSLFAWPKFRRAIHLPNLCRPYERRST